MAALALLGVLGACAMSGNVSATTTTTPGTGGSPTASTGASPTATSPSGPAPTNTPAPAAALQGQLLVQSLGSIGPNTNSVIKDVTCPAGFLVAGGGINSGYTNFTTMENAPISTTTWRAEIFNNSSSTIAAQVQVMCVKAPGLTGQVVTQGLGAIGPNTNSTIADVACPAGYLAAGGGVASGYTHFTTMQAAPISATTWREEIFNNSGSTIYAQVQVICLRATGLTGQVVTKTLGAINANTNSVIVDVACPAGFLVAGGGINSGYTNFTTMWNAPISTTTLRAEIFNNGSSTIYAQAQTQCLKVS